MGRLLKVTEVAEMLNVCTKTVRTNMSKGTIAFVKVGRTHRISHEEVVRVMREGTEKVHTPSNQIAFTPPANIPREGEAWLI